MNRLILGTKIQARLREELPPDVHVLAISELDTVLKGTAPTPSVQVFLQSERVLEKQNSGMSYRKSQTWVVVIGVRNVRNVKSGEDAMLDAGALAARVESALMGWCDDTLSKPLQPTDAPRPSYVAGQFFYPVAFAAERVFRK